MVNIAQTTPTFDHFSLDRGVYVMTNLFCLPGTQHRASITRCRCLR